MYGFDDKQLVASGPFWRIWRGGDVAFMSVEGPIDDARSVAWQQGLTAEFDRRGFPRFFAMDVSKTDPSNSMTGRFRTAQYVRATLQNLTCAVVLTKAHAGPLVVVRAILRLVGMSNVSVFVDDHAFRAAIDEMRAGRVPLAVDPMLPGN